MHDGHVLDAANSGNTFLNKPLASSIAARRSKKDTGLWRASAGSAITCGFFDPIFGAYP